MWVWAMAGHSASPLPQEQHQAERQRYRQPEFRFGDRLDRDYWRRESDRGSIGGAITLQDRTALIKLREQNSYGSVVGRGFPLPSRMLSWKESGPRFASKFT